MRTVERQEESSEHVTAWAFAPAPRSPLGPAAGAAAPWCVVESGAAGARPGVATQGMWDTTALAAAALGAALVAVAVLLL